MMKSLFVVCLISCYTMINSFAQADESEEVVELFRVSKVGAPNAAETKETLISLYNAIKEKHNAELAAEPDSEKFKGTQIRIIKVLEDGEADLPLYIVAYNGGPALAKIVSDEPFEPGELTPPLIIDADGEQEVEFERKVDITPVGNGKEAQLEKVDKSSGGSFFGIPVESSGGEYTYRLVKEKKVLNELFSHNLYRVAQ